MSGPEPLGPAAATAPASSWRRLRAALLARPTRGQFLLAALLAGLGFGVVTQAQQAADLSGLRQSDLVGLLDDVSERRAQLEAERADLEARLQRLTSSSGSAAEARAAAEDQRDTYAILAGTAPAIGPGLLLAVRDPDGGVGAVTLLDAVQELRDAGAEAIQIGDVRVVASTAFVQDRPGVVQIGDGTVRSPFQIVAIGDPTTMETALRIPGGVFEAITQTPGARAQLTITQSEEVVIDAVVPLDDLDFATPQEPAQP